jgi:hypothetical protein
MANPTRDSVLAIVQQGIDQLAEAVTDITKAAQALPDAQVVLTNARTRMQHFPKGSVVASDNEVTNAYDLLVIVQAALNQLANIIPSNHPSVTPARTVATSIASQMQTATGKAPPKHPL